MSSMAPVSGDPPGSPSPVALDELNASSAADCSDAMEAI